MQQRQVPVIVGTLLHSSGASVSPRWPRILESHLLVYRVGVACGRLTDHTHVQMKNADDVHRNQRAKKLNEAREPIELGKAAPPGGN